MKIFYAFVVCALVSSTGVAQKPQAKIVGIYTESKDGQIVQAGMRLEIRPGGKWAMANMLTGYWGTWKSSAKGATLMCTEGPAGKINKPDIIQAALIGPTQLKLTVGKNSRVFRRLPSTEKYMIPGPDGK